MAVSIAAYWRAGRSAALLAAPPPLLLLVLYQQAGCTCTARAGGLTLGPHPTYVYFPSATARAMRGRLPACLPGGECALRCGGRFCPWRLALGAGAGQSFARSLPCRAYLGALFQFVWIGHFKESPPAPAAAGEKRRVGGWEKRTKTQVARERKQRQQAQLAPCE
jgi:hypothetical protein